MKKEGILTVAYCDPSAGISNPYLDAFKSIAEYLGIKYNFIEFNPRKFTPTLVYEVLHDINKNADIFLLPGGADLSAALTVSALTSQNRDDPNYSVMAKFLHKVEIPIVGICLGFQMLCSVKYRLSLIETTNHAQGSSAMHPLDIRNLNWTIPVTSINSRHNQGVQFNLDLLKRLNESGLTVGYSQDFDNISSTLEVLYDKEDKIFAIQGHPESFIVNYKDGDEVKTLKCHPILLEAVVRLLDLKVNLKNFQYKIISLAGGTVRELA